MCRPHDDRQRLRAEQLEAQARHALRVAHAAAHEGEFAGKGNGLVLDMCETMGAEMYIFGAGGRDYAQEEDFRAAGIELCFQEYVHPEYPQLHGEFIAGSSIVDLLFNCGDNSLDILMEGNIAKAVAQPTVVGN